MFYFKKYILSFFVSTLFSITITIPIDYSSIQEGIDISQDGDTIKVVEGVYYESMINSGGKNIIISGEIDAGGFPLVTINGEGNESVIFMFNGADGEGCTIENLIITNSSGNAIWMYFSNPVIKNCTLSNNIGQSGASAIWGSDSDPWIDGCTFINNSTDIILQNSSIGNIANSVFNNNEILNSMNSIILNGSSAFIYDSQFNGNNLNGGKIISYGYNNGEYSDIRNCLFNNYIDTIFEITRTNIEINDSQFKNNNVGGSLIVINELEPVSVLIAATDFCGNGTIDSDILIDGTWIDYGGNNFSLNCLSHCNPDYVDINGICFHEGDISVLQKFIDNSYDSAIDLGCEEYGYSSYCGSPNPQMDSPTDAWFWNIIDSTEYFFANGNGIVEPLELGLQEWQDGRLKSLMCGAYIYCQLSGPIPEEIVELSEIETLRLEYNYLSGFIPDNICELDTDYSDYLIFDLGGNRLCPPYPECIDTSGFWSQDTSLCSEIGDLNYDTIINIQDIIILISFIINTDFYDYQDLVISDINIDGILNILDVVMLVSEILND